MSCQKNLTQVCERIRSISAAWWSNTSPWWQRLQQLVKFPSKWALTDISLAGATILGAKESLRVRVELQFSHHHSRADNLIAVLAQQTWRNLSWPVRQETNPSTTTCFTEYFVIKSVWTSENFGQTLQKLPVGCCLDSVRIKLGIGAAFGAIQLLVFASCCYIRHKRLKLAIAWCLSTLTNLREQRHTAHYLWSHGFTQLLLGNVRVLISVSQRNLFAPTGTCLCARNNLDFHIVFLLQTLKQGTQQQQQCPRIQELRLQSICSCSSPKSVIYVPMPLYRAVPTTF